MKFKKIAGYTALWILFFTYFTYLRFPYEAVKEPLLRKLSRLIPFKVSVGSIGPNYLGGIRIREVTVAHPLLPEKALLLNSDLMDVRPVAHYTLIGRPTASFDIETCGGSLDGDIGMGSDSRHLSLSIDDIQIADHPIIKELFKGALKSRVSGKINISTKSGGISTADGNIRISMKDGTVEPVAVEGLPFQMIPVGLTFSGLELDIKIEKGKATIEKLSLKGNDIEATAEGTLILADTRAIMSSQLNAEIKLKPVSQKFKDMAKLLEVRYKKGPDDQYVIPLRGSLGRPQV